MTYYESTKFKIQEFDEISKEVAFYLYGLINGFRKAKKLSYEETIELMDMLPLKDEDYDKLDTF
jgi:hypothetical protein